MEVKYRQLKLFVYVLPSSILDKNRKPIVLLLLFLIVSMPFAVAEELNLVYDGNGNLISGDGKTREYNEFNQLIRVNDSTSNIVLEEYIYHPIEDRVLAKKVYNDSVFQESYVLYVNKNFVRTYFDLQGTPKVNDTYYVFDDMGLVGEMVKNSSYRDDDFFVVGKSFYHNDHLGSTSVLTNQTGDVIEETFYAPYGEILSGGENSRYDYEGKEFSELTEDYDYNFRKYDPKIGIFTQPDAVIPNVYDPQSLNRYAFERNNPYKYVDENGQSPVHAVLIAATVGAVFSAGSYWYGAFTGQYSFNPINYLGNNLGGAVGGAVAAASVIYGGSIGGVVGGAGGNVISQAANNLATGMAITSNLREAAAVGAASPFTGKFFPDVPLEEVLLPSITRGTGQFTLNEFGQNFLSLYFNYGFSSNSFSNSYQINQAAGNNENYGSYCDVYGCYSTTYSSGGGDGSSSSGNSPSNGGNSVYDNLPKPAGCGIWMSCA